MYTAPLDQIDLILIMIGSNNISSMITSLPIKIYYFTSYVTNHKVQSRFGLSILVKQSV